MNIPVLMPTTTAPRSASKPTGCFAHRHMSLKEYGLWTLARELSAKSGYYFFDGKTQGRTEFDNVGYKQMYSTVHSLEDKGWFIPTNKCERKDDGTFAGTAYIVVSHDEWVVGHPDGCSKPVDEMYTG